MTTSVDEVSKPPPFTIAIKWYRAYNLQVPIEGNPLNLKHSLHYTSLHIIGSYLSGFIHLVLPARNEYFCPSFIRLLRMKLQSLQIPHRPCLLSHVTNQLKWVSFNLPWDSTVSLGNFRSLLCCCGS